MAFVATLGTHGFHSWKAEGAPFTLPKEHLEIETRSGLDGFISWNVGSYGDKFIVDTITLIDTYANAVDKKYVYEQLKGGVALTLTFTNEVTGYKFLVVEVMPKVTAIVRGHAAGDATHYLARIDTKWTLAAIPYTGQ